MHWHLCGVKYFPGSFFATDLKPFTGFCDEGVYKVVVDITQQKKDKFS